MFEVFWNAYPRKIGKFTARKSWEKIKPTQNILNRMLKSIAYQKKSEQWQEKKYIPHPTTWLNQRRWEDDIPEPSPCEYKEEYRAFASCPACGQSHLDEV